VRGFWSRRLGKPRMVAVTEMAKFMDDDVVDYRLRGHESLPIEIERAVSPARSSMIAQFSHGD